MVIHLHARTSRSDVVSSKTEASWGFCDTKISLVTHGSGKQEVFVDFVDPGSPCGCNKMKIPAHRRFRKSFDRSVGVPAVLCLCIFSVS